MTKLAMGSLAVFLVALVWVLPAFAAKALLSDRDLDGITAAGDPAVLIAESSNGGATITNNDSAAFALNIPTDAQKGLRALTVANVVGEVQLLVNLNVMSAQTDVAGTDQRNFSVQSWGSTMPNLKATVDGVPGIDQSDCNNKCQANGNIGVVAAPGQIQIASASGDLIMSATGHDGATVENNQSPAFALGLEPNAQVDLAALFIANIVGRAQTAYNINIAAATLNLIPDPGVSFTTPFQNATAVIKQVNSGVQFRGTPIGVGNTAGVISVTHTPN